MNVYDLERNTVASFRLAKKDIAELYNSVNYLLKQVAELKQENTFLNRKISSKKRTVVKTVKKVATKTTKRKFIATKGGNKVHDSHCPFAKNIKPKNKVVFGTKTTALNKGYKPCKCLN